MTHPELAAEQAYVDRAYDQLDHMRSTVARTQEAMATEWAALNMEAWVKRRMRTFEDAERGLVFGRLTLDGTPRPLYVGRRWVHDDEHESLVVNWQAPAARPFYTATPQTPHGVQQRRRFRSEGRHLTDLSDESLDGRGRSRPMPRSCYAFTAVWTGPAAALRPRRFRLCPEGVYARGVLYPLPRGVWAWFDLNV